MSGAHSPVCDRHHKVVRCAAGEFVIAEASEVLEGKTKADAAALSVGGKVEVEFFMDGAKKIVAKAKVSGAATTK